MCIRDRAQHVIVTPSGGTIEKTGYDITLSSLRATHLCYTIDKTEPLCTSVGCSNGVLIGSPIGIIKIYPGTFKIVGCAAIDSAVRTIEYEESKHAQNIEVDPIPYSSIEKMSHVQITSKNASYICYTVSGSLPVCEDEGQSCLKGLEIHGSTGNTIPINADSVLRIIGCNDITSTPVANSVSTRSTVFYYISKEAEPVYFIPADGTIINHNTKIFIESAYSNIICYTLDGTEPICHALGEVCEHGTRISNFNGHTTLITTHTTV